MSFSEDLQPHRTGTRTFFALSSDLLTCRVGLLVIAILVGLANAALVIGWTGINPMNISWLDSDPATYYLSWAFYRRESAWSLPLWWTGRLGYPLGVSIASFDAVPLVAVVLRPFASLLPEPFQYLGLYACLCFVLQAYFGMRLCHRLFGANAVFVIAGGIFFLVSPAITRRVFGHYSLLSHWLILASLDYYFRDTAHMSTRQWLKPHWIILALAGAINPYMAALCLLITFAALVRLAFERRCSWVMSAAGFLLATAVLLSSMAAFGFLTGIDRSSYVGTGYGLYSFNLLSPINPMYHGSIVLPSLPVAMWEQYEGYNYLGIGIIGLLVLGLVRYPKSVLWLADRKLLPLVAVALICTAAALSTTVTVGSITLVQFRIPRVAAFFAEGLRASGRLFWPVHYLLIVAAVSLAYWRCSPPYREVLLAAALAVQLADVWTIRTQVRAVFDRHVQDPLRSPRWKELGRDHARLIVIPPFQCGPELAPGGRETYAIFGMLAAAQGMQTNNYYAARYSKREIQVHCVEVPTVALVKHELDPDAAYVVHDAARAEWAIAGVASHRCDKVDGFNLCTRQHSGAAPSLESIRKGIAYTLGQRIDFKASGDARKYMVYGWSFPEADSTATEGPLAKLALSVNDAFRGPLRLTADVEAFVTKRHPQVDVEVVINGHMVDRWDFHHGSASQTKHVLIPASVIGDRGIISIEFRIRNPQAPASVGAGPDDRLLGLAVRELRFTREP